METGSTGTRAGEGLGRRGLVAGLAAAGAALVAKLSGSPPIAEAGHGVGIDPEALHRGLINSSVSVTQLRSSNGPVTMAPLGAAGSGMEVMAADNGFAGLIGQSKSSIGVLGNAVSGRGVAGNAIGGIGVEGDSISGIGVRGESENGTALAGISFAGIGADVTAGGNLAAVRGLNTNPSTGAGVLGLSDNSVGVQGVGKTFGVLAQANGDSGVALRASVNSGLAVYGSCGNAGGSGVYAENSGGGYGLRGFSTGIGLLAQGAVRAAQFIGNVDIQGGLQLLGASISSTAVHTDGTHRRVHSVDATEPVIEDFGRGHLVNGVANVALDTDFAAVVQSDDYDAFFTPHGPLGVLYIAGQDARGFVVRSETSSATGSFSYRVVAKRRDAGGSRLQRVEARAAPAEVPLRYREVPNVPDVRAAAREAEQHQRDMPDFRDRGEAPESPRRGGGERR